MDYGFEHAGTVYTPNRTAGIKAADSAKRNAEIEASELVRWASCPDTQVAYYNFAAGTRADSLHLYSARTLADCTVTTWTGKVIGTITAANVYRHNFGGQFVSMRVIGTNGAEYYGRASYDWGTVIKLRRVR
jgi:hypothetical protein